MGTSQNAYTSCVNRIAWKFNLYHTERFHGPFCIGFWHAPNAIIFVPETLEEGQADWMEGGRSYCKKQKQMKRTNSVTMKLTNQRNRGML